jgi:hypothetical protein
MGRLRYVCKQGAIPFIAGIIAVLYGHAILTAFTD